MEILPEKSVVKFSVEDETTLVVTVSGATLRWDSLAHEMQRALVKIYVEQTSSRSPAHTSPDSYHKKSA